MNELHVGRGTTRGAMTVFPLWAAGSGSSRYAIGGQRLDVTEVENGPDVGTLVVHNTGDRPALVLEGQLFEGGWQHRMAVHSTMIGAHQRTRVEVACVEQGRWGGTAQQRSRGRRATPYVRDSVRRGGDVQSEVWNRVSRHAGEPGTRDSHNPTGSFVRRLDEADAERAAWSTLCPLPGQVGVLIGIGGQPYIAEVFETEMQLRGQMPSLLEAAALDARLAPPVETPARRARRFVERIDWVRDEHLEPAGIAVRRRGSTEYVDIATLRWEDQDVHSRMTNVRHPLLAA